MTPSRPVLRYHGGKWRIARWVIGHFPKHRIYVEAYGGAASVLIQKPRCYSEVYNELDDDVTNIFRVMREPAACDQLSRLLTLTPYSRSEWERAYEPCADPVEKARRAIVRSFMGYGSDSTWVGRSTGFRSNANRQGTVPALDWAGYPPLLALFAQRFRGVLVDQRPALEVVREHDSPKTLHYLDPPYVRKTRGRTQAYQHEMTDEQHREMAAVARVLKGMVVVSGYRCDLYDELFGDWRRVDKRVKVMGNQPRVESLWLSPACCDALSHGRTLFDSKEAGDVH